MRNFLLLTCVLIVLCFACAKQDKGCTPVNPAAEEPQILTYISANSINATKDDSSGIYYQIVEPGSGVAPTATSQISVSYVGKLLNGTVFDQHTSPVPFNLSSGIEGWQIGLPLIKKGGRIKLLIPSAYAYSCNGKGSIPPNSVLFFDIRLDDVQ